MSIYKGTDFVAGVPDETNFVHKMGVETITGSKTFSAVAYGTASDAVNSILTTVNKSKASNGYFEFGNGLIVNWGKTDAVLVASSTVGTLAVSFSKAYTTTPQVVTTTNNNTTNANYGYVNSGVSSVTTTGFTLAIASKSSANTNSGAFWIAIGY